MISSAILYAVTGSGLFSLGLYGLIMYAHLLRKILAINVMGSGIFLLLVALAYRNPDQPDVVPHAMVITGIVVAVSATALAIGLMLKLATHSSSTQLPDED
jgi:multicomponent Na+:H+ antiporter subunit C